MTMPHKVWQGKFLISTFLFRNAILNEKNKTIGEVNLEGSFIGGGLALSILRRTIVVWKPRGKSREKSRGNPQCNI